jgi:uncharacterized protein (DUF1697 family)
LRAVNVSGVNCLPMADLRKALAAQGLLGVKTYIQSGNLVFRSDQPAHVLGPMIADTIHANFGFRPPVLILSREQVLAALAANPFPQAAAEPTTLHFFFLERALPEAGLAFLKSVAVEGEKYAFRGKVLWLHLPHGIGRSKLAQRVGALPIDMTARNLRSVQAIADLAASFGPD